MKKRKLKKWVKVVLAIMVLGMIARMIKILNDFDRDELSKCVNVGNELEYCEKGLR